MSEPTEPRVTIEKVFLYQFQIEKSCLKNVSWNLFFTAHVWSKGSNIKCSPSNPLSLQTCYFVFLICISFFIAFVLFPLVSLLRLRHIFSASPVILQRSALPLCNYSSVSAESSIFSALMQLPLCVCAHARTHVRLALVRSSGSPGTAMPTLGSSSLIGGPVRGLRSAEFSKAQLEHVGRTRIQLHIGQKVILVCLLGAQITHALPSIQAHGKVN